MTTSKPLLEELRRAAGHGYQSYCMTLCEKAADEIERLTRENEHLQNGRCSELRYERDQLREQLSETQRALEEAIADKVHFRAEYELLDKGFRFQSDRIRELEGALREIDGMGCLYMRPNNCPCPCCIARRTLGDARFRESLTPKPPDAPRREYHANGTYWNGVPTVDMPCDFCGGSIMDHHPQTHACPPDTSGGVPVDMGTAGGGHGSERSVNTLKAGPAEAFPNAGGRPGRGAPDDATAAPAKDPQIEAIYGEGWRACEFCGCRTNAKARACCNRGREADETSV